MRARGGDAFRCAAGGGLRRPEAAVCVWGRLRRPRDRSHMSIFCDHYGDKYAMCVNNIGNGENRENREKAPNIITPSNSILWTETKFHGRSPVHKIELI